MYDTLAESLRANSAYFTETPVESWGQAMKYVRMFTRKTYRPAKAWTLYTHPETAYGYYCYNAGVGRMDKEGWTEKYIVYRNKMEKQAIYVAIELYDAAGKFVYQSIHGYVWGAQK